MLSRAGSFRRFQHPNVNLWVGYPYRIALFRKGIMGYHNLIHGFCLGAILGTQDPKPLALNPKPWLLCR